MPKRTRLPILALALAGSLTSAAWGTTLLHLSDDQLIDRADAIVTGRCSGVESRWQGRLLMTAATVEVTDVLKGEQGTPVQGGTLTVWLPGGIDLQRQIPIAVTFPGAPALAPGEELLLFLSAAGETGGYGITGFSQGKFTLVESPDGPVAIRDLSGLELVRGGGTRRGSRHATPLAEIKARIAERLTGTAPALPEPQD